MKIAYWKKLLSHIIDFRLEKKKSNFSGDLEIILSRGRFALCTRNAMYSYDDLYLNFRNAFHKLDISGFKTEKVLILGTGLLSVPYILEKLHQKKFICKAVDIDPEVINAAEKYGLPRLNSAIRLICEDAARFVANEREKYDLIVVDIFIDNLVPTKFETIEFLRDLKNLLKENGLLMYNRMAQNDEALKKTELFYNQLFKEVFTKSEILEIKSNRMLLGNFSLKTKSKDLTVEK